MKMPNDVKQNQPHVLRNKLDKMTACRDRLQRELERERAYSASLLRIYARLGDKLASLKAIAERDEP
jgi:hypothetical protein